MWNSIVNLLKRGLRIGAQLAPDIAAAYNPLLGVLVSKISAAVLASEAIGGPKQGPLKWDIATTAVQFALPEIEHAFSAAGKPVRNPELFAAGLAKIQDGIVDIMNATGEGAKLLLAEAAPAQ